MGLRKSRERKRARFDVLSFLNIQSDKIQNRCSGFSKPMYKGLEFMPREDFKDWSLQQGKLFVLFHQWNRSGHELKYRPTIDRLDSSEGYIPGNMEWVTFSENCRRAGLKGR